MQQSEYENNWGSIGFGRDMEINCSVLRILHVWIYVSFVWEENQQAIFYKKCSNAYEKEIKDCFGWDKQNYGLCLFIFL